MFPAVQNKSIGIAWSQSQEGSAQNRIVPTSPPQPDDERTSVTP